MKRLAIALWATALLIATAPFACAEASDWAGSWTVASSSETDALDSGNEASKRYEWLLNGESAGFYLREGDVFRLYNLNGEAVTSYEWNAETFEPFFFISFSGYDENGLARVGDCTPSGAYLYGLIDRDGQMLLELQMDDILDFHEGRAPFCKDGLWGYLDLSGNIAIAAAYPEVSAFSEERAAVRIENRWGFVDVSGTSIVPAKYVEVEAFVGGYCIVGIQEEGLPLYGLIDRDGHELLEPIYEALVRTDDGVYRATLGDEKRYFSIQNGQAAAVATVSTSVNLDDYAPNEGAKVPVLDAPASLQLVENLPRLNGATALVPLYAAVAQAVYPSDVRWTQTADDSTAVFQYTNTVGAYQGLIDGTCDLIFVAQPSDAQLQAAKNAGVELNLTPIGCEAFVFFVHADNPLNDISLSQIRGVYSGEITKWDELGCEGLGEIIAYQRPANSGSQTALEKLMGDTPIMPAPQERMEDSWNMDDIVSVIEYRNQPNAIGYSFRFFLKEMMNSQVKLLSIDGVAPTEENIVMQRYPIIATVYAVSRKDDSNPHLAALLEWLQGEQGMELVRKSGYTPAIQYQDGKIVENLIP